MDETKKKTAFRFLLRLGPGESFRLKDVPGNLSGIEMMKVIEGTEFFITTGTIRGQKEVLIENAGLDTLPDLKIGKPVHFKGISKQDFKKTVEKWGGLKELKV